MTFADVHMLVAIKLFFLFFLVVSLFFIRKKVPLWSFLLFFGVVSSASYLLLVNNHMLLFWGLQGDEITVAAMYNTFAHVGLWSDFAFHNLPAFYPPGYFWLFAILGNWFGWNGIQIAKVATATFFLFFPIVIYFFCKILEEKKKIVDNLTYLVFIFLAPLIIMSTLGIDLLIGKPYEIVSAVLTIFWTIALYVHILTKKLSWKEVLSFGIIAGVIFMLYYLWLVFAGMVFIIQMFFLKRTKIFPYLLDLIKVALVGIIVALPFILPLVLTYINVGMESWQTAFYIPANSKLWLPITQFGSSANIILFVGFISILWYSRETIPRLLLSFLGAAFLWWGLGLFLLLFFSTPFQEFRGFYVLSPVVVSIGAAYGISRFWQFFKEKRDIHGQQVLMFVGVLLLGAHAIFGFFVDDPIVQQNAIISKTLPENVFTLVEVLKTLPEADSLVTLHSVPQILAFFPINHYLYFNQNNTHPAAIFSVRFATISALELATSSKEAYNIVTSAPYGPIDQFIFYKQDGLYTLYFHLDKPIQGIEERKISFSQELFSATYFEKVYDSGHYTILRRKSTAK
ncbi:MAG: hypothetical protein COX81_00965 [Candidatus Magasanikbacteria bacterium CG_4_10_14_0_2_um_filter_37_12]|uniref:Arabinofuranosyltransferase AftA N-terminal domain-containing protein n=1 Tax=Candidatus Magasanikbacteria bacterium CG_4_10_14_0_2_um_filter_37_12 TaxID=1974637 RepID=A0A2M7V942_9BACT|nr:MAG: hypothetical protein COX81_00965 [Candidatus Magasanikbacteria bacterium CG_4_10_14_0_2_um_filter_37_12]